MTAPRDPLTAHLLEQVSRAHGDTEVVERRLAAAIRAAREFGCTYTAIGAAAGHTESWARRIMKEPRS